mmetsp:Transcript_16705/g.47530  ORF Transcript_16705/g.47530 Transcript_16705/m.47530 type:complete len:407 (+) Transcript_16705:1-1221(+)
MVLDYPEWGLWLSGAGGAPPAPLSRIPHAPRGIRVHQVVSVEGDLRVEREQGGAEGDGVAAGHVRVPAAPRVPLAQVPVAVRGVAGALRAVQPVLDEVELALADHVFYLGLVGAVAPEVVDEDAVRVAQGLVLPLAGRCLFRWAGGEERRAEGARGENRGRVAVLQLDVVEHQLGQEAGQAKLQCSAARCNRWTAHAEAGLQREVLQAGETHAQAIEEREHHGHADNELEPPQHPGLGLEHHGQDFAPLAEVQQDSLPVAQREVVLRGKLHLCAEGSECEFEELHLIDDLGAGGGVPVQGQHGPVQERVIDQRRLARHAEPGHHLGARLLGHRVLDVLDAGPVMHGSSILRLENCVGNVAHAAGPDAAALEGRHLGREARRAHVHLRPQGGGHWLGRRRGRRDPPK